VPHPFAFFLANGWDNRNLNAQIHAVADLAERALPTVRCSQSYRLISLCRFQSTQNMKLTARIAGTSQSESGRNSYVIAIPHALSAV